MENAPANTAFGMLLSPGGTLTRDARPTLPLILPGGNRANVRLEARVSLPSSGQHFAGLTARIQDARNFYWAGVVAYGGVCSAFLFRIEDGVAHFLNVAPLKSSQGDLRFDAVGNLLRLSFNNNLVTMACDNRWATGDAGCWFSPDNPPSDLRCRTLALSTQRPLQPLVGNHDWKQRLGRFFPQDDGWRASNSLFNVATVRRLWAKNGALEAHVDLESSGFQYGGLVARYRGPEHFLWAGLLSRFGEHYLAIHRHTKKSWSILAQRRATAGQGLIRFELKGRRLTVSLNGEPSLEAKIDKARPGRIGMRASSGVVLKNFHLQAT